MTNRVREPSDQPDLLDMPAPARPGGDANPIRQASVIAGVGILVIAVLGIFGNFIALEGLLTPGNAAGTAEGITGSEGVFRLGIASVCLLITLDIVVAWALFRVFSPVSEGLSMLAACLRIVYAGIYMVAVSQLIGVLQLLGNDGYLSVFTTEQRQAQALMRIDTFTNIWDAGLILFGLHLLLLGYLAYRSGYMPRLLGILLAVAGLGYLFDSFGAILSQGSPPNVGAYTWVGEFLLALWLLIRGRRITVNTPGSRKDPAAVAQ